MFRAPASPFPPTPPARAGPGARLRPNVAPRPLAPPDSSSMTRRWNSVLSAPAGRAACPPPPAARARHRAADPGSASGRAEPPAAARLAGSTTSGGMPRPAIWYASVVSANRSESTTRPGRERRPDHRPHQLGASGEVEEQLRHRTHRVLGIEHRLPGDLAGRRAAGLAHDDRIHSACPHPLRQRSPPASTCPSPRAPPGR